jgi:hypothetical protein
VPPVTTETLGPQGSERRGSLGRAWDERIW